MKKAILLFGLISSVFFYSQNYSSLDKILEKLENRSKKTKDASDFDIKDKKFVLIEDFDDHSERHILEFKNDNSLTLIEVIDDKSTDKTYSNIFSGDYIRKKNAVSVRADLLEGKKISIPISHNLYLMNANNIWYLKDINTNKRWIENSNLLKKKK
ncbi:hypothetical protein [Epilithonimonas sp.]|uniref:hypothetical protein n=1 Tax=Epilithonimonas sp. TaxID=2894511 RepID=UPI00289B20F1|nr:hypothetical protein [Epilithonimonas sp.]